MMRTPLTSKMNSLTLRGVAYPYAFGKKEYDKGMVDKGMETTNRPSYSGVPNFFVPSPFARTLRSGVPAGRPGSRSRVFRVDVQAGA